MVTNQEMTGQSRLVSSEHFEEMFKPLRGKRIGYVRMPGNVGDRLIEDVTFDLAVEFECKFELVDVREKCVVEELVIAGGGNMGPTWRECHELRQRALQTGLPVTVFPQSFIEPEAGAYRQIYVREADSLRYCPHAALVADLALAARRRQGGLTKVGVGVWLRDDPHGLFRDHASLGDPIRHANSVREYLDLASQCEVIITDRLHFAIAGLITGRATTLLPLKYHKNRSMWETWLKSLGCGWAESPDQALWQLNSPN